MTRRRSGLAAAVLVVGLVLAGCGVPTQQQPEIVEREDVPFGLVRDQARQSTTTSTTSPTSSTTP
jgi:hypothetical protein